MRLIVDLQGAQGSNSARGIGRYSRELALAMARDSRGHDVIIVLSAAMPEIAESLAASFDGILPRSSVRFWHPPPGIAASSGSPLRAFAETLRAQFLASLGPDLVHVCSLFEGLSDDVVSLQPPHLERLPVVATCYDLIPLIRHDDYFGQQDPTSAAARWYYRCVQEMSQCDGLLAISDSSRGDAIRHLPFPPDRVFNVRAGISADFRPADLSTDARAELLRRYGLAETFILFVGAGDLRKNMARLITAYALLPQELRDRHQLAIVGTVDESELRRTATDLHVPAEGFVVIPFVREADLRGLYSSCALFVFPSLHEGFGLPLAEAMACGAPAISSNTTSMPEVIGCLDATFEPTDPAAIAACMRKALENPAFRDRLAAHGPVQAGRFTWHATAARAWDALEQINARTSRQDAARPVSVLQRRRRLAFVSPLPPQPSGIADYSAELLPSLARHYDITLVSETPVEDRLLEGAFPHLDPAAFLQQAEKFDRVLYQIGNSGFHRFQIEDLLPHCPGVVVLHDAFLSDSINSLVHQQGRPDDFRAVLLHSHSYPALRYESTHGRTATLRQYPCCLAVLQNAIGIIQHSRHGVAVLAEHFGVAATRGIAILPLLRSDRLRPGRAVARAALGLNDHEFVVCSLGSVTSSKSPALLAEAWRRAGLLGRMVFAGDIAPEMQQVLADGPAGIEFTGRLSREQYDAWISAADLAVQWRTGSRGESSAAVADALMAGLPLIVNRHGSAAELPEKIVYGLSEQADVQALAAAIVDLHADPASRAALSAAARAFALSELAPRSVAVRYRDAIEHAYAIHAPATMAQELEPTARLPGGLFAASRAIVRSLASPWRAGGRPRLLIDVSDLERARDGRGLRRMVREVGRRVLETPPPGRKGEAVRSDAGQLRHTYAVPMSMLAHPPLTLPEAPLDPIADDVLLYTDVNSGLTAAEFDDLRRLRLAGVRIALVVHDVLPLRDPEYSQAPAAVARGDWYRRMIPIADCVACVTRAVEDDLLAWLDEDRGRRTTPLPVGCFELGGDFRPDAATEPASPAVQAALASARQRPTVMMTGSVEAVQGYQQALAAFEMLWDAGEDLGLVIAGQQGWQLEALGARLQPASAVGDRLHWVPECDDAGLWQLYRAASGLLVASDHDGFGLPVIEAAHAALPVLLRDLPRFRRMAGEHARYFDGTGPEALVAAVRNWVAAGFSPMPAGLRSPSWDDSFRLLGAAVIDEQWSVIWRP